MKTVTKLLRGLIKMQEFIEAFRQTSCYRAIIQKENVVTVYIAGSRACDAVDERSDYDIQIITTDGEYEDVSKKYYLTWRGVKVHWYISPIHELTKWSKYKLMRYGGINALRYYRPELVIYENPKYADMLRALYDCRNEISDISIYHFYYHEKRYIDRILDAGEILECHHSKRIYHLCLSSYLITGDEVDKDFLRSIKRIRWQPVPEEYKRLAVERLRKLKECVESPDILLRINPERSIDEILNG